MSSGDVIAVSKIMLGFLGNEVKKKIIKRLQNGDAADEMLLNMMVDEVQAIHQTLHCLGRVPLLSSYMSLKDGLNELSQSLNQLKEHEITPELSDTKDIAADSQINEALALLNATKSLNLHCSKQFNKAIGNFDTAHKKATDAFVNDALPLEDRITASQLRIIAKLFMGLENLECSIISCLDYIKDLHALQPVQQYFSVMIEGGFKSRLKSKRRAKNVSGVQAINQTLFEVIKTFTKTSLLACLRDWPVIYLGESSYHPLLAEERQVKKLTKFSVQVTSLSYLPDYAFGEKIYCGNFAVVNSRAEVVALTHDKRAFKSFGLSGESNVLCAAPSPKHSKDSACCIRAMDVDVENNIFIITTVADQPHEWTFILLIFDNNGIKKLESPLSFLRSSSSVIRMAINKNGKIFFLNCDEKCIYVGSVCFVENSVHEETRLFLRDIQIVYRLLPLMDMRLSEFDGTNIIVANNRSVHIYAENGQLRHKFEIPHEHGIIISVAINHLSRNIIVKTHTSSTLLSFSETGKPLQSLKLGSREVTRQAVLTSHPNGPVVLVGKTRAAILQL